MSEKNRFLQAAARRSKLLLWVGMTVVVLAIVGLVIFRISARSYEPLPMEWATVPAGEFLMGSPEGYKNAFPDEFPQHAVFLDEFQINVYEVNNQLYQQCVRAGVCERPQFRYDNSDYPDHPVVGVDWDDAQTFCTWVGGRLPSEAEWEKAARGGLPQATYPWGDKAPNCSHANFYRGKDCVGDTSPVGSYPPNGYGLYDMSGNVWEWIADWYDSDYYAVSPYENPQGPPRGDARIVRGGSLVSEAGELRCAYRYRYEPDILYYAIGFRCARSRAPE